jgi:hypothetical protein
MGAEKKGLGDPDYSDNTLHMNFNITEWHS